jgi:hypothetical protein
VPHDTTINADAVTGDHPGEPFNLGDAITWLCRDSRECL